MASREPLDRSTPVAPLGTPPADPWERVGKAIDGGNRFRREDVVALHAEVGRCRILLDQELSFRDLEAKIRDGAITLRAVGGEEGGNAAMRLFCSILLHLMLGEDGETPPNYQSFEWSIKPANEHERMRLYAEIVKPDGKTSHEIRRDLEAQVERLSAEDEA